MGIILLDGQGKKHRIPPGTDVVRIPDLGTVNVARAEGNVGRRIEVGGRAFLVLRASSLDLRETMARGAQTLSPKDLGALLYYADIVAGSKVVEAGAGSGGLTMLLARAVGPSGRVFSYDLREESLRVARTNAEAAGVAETVEFRQADVRQGIAEREVDAAILDLIDPWSVVPAAWEALRPCGCLASFSPNMEQVKETVAAIRKHPFVDVRTVELIEREMEVREVGVRPSFAALGHTGYLTFARKVLEAF